MQKCKNKAKVTAYTRSKTPFSRFGDKDLQKWQSCKSTKVAKSAKGKTGKSCKSCKKLQQVAKVQNEGKDSAYTSSKTPFSRFGDNDKQE